VRDGVALLLAEHDAEAQLARADIAVRPRADPWLTAAAEDTEPFSHYPECRVMPSEG
jgi:hypothetical protein